MFTMFSVTSLPEIVLNGIQVTWKKRCVSSRCEGWKPGEREAPKDSPHAPPWRAFLPSGHFLLQLLYARLIIPDGLQLGSKHDQGENGKQQRLEDKQDEQDDCDCWGASWASAPFTIDAPDEMIDCQEKGVAGDHCYVQSEEDKKLLVVLANAVVHPRAMVVHLADTSLAHAAMMRPLRLEATALGTFVN